MNRFYSILMTVSVVITIWLFLGSVSQAQEKTTAEGKESATLQAPKETALEVKFAAICRGVVDLKLVQADTSFPASVGKLYCFTTIVGAQSPIEITHVWYHGGTLRARVILPVNSLHWRTYSSKIIQPHEIGQWHVDVLAPDGSLLVSVLFDITSL